MVPALTPPGVVVRVAVPGDAGELLTVQRAAFLTEAQRYGDPFLAPLREDLAGVAAAIAGQVVLVALRGPRLVGSVRLRVEGTTGHVGRLVVAPDQQRLGLGSALLSAVEEAARHQVAEFALFTGADSAENVARYERAGYVRLGPAQAGSDVDDRGVRLVHLHKPRT